MATTYEPIATTTLGSAAASITFSSIPSTYTDLRLVYIGNNTNSNATIFRLNSDSGSNYSYTMVAGNGSVVGSNRGTSNTYAWLSSLYVSPSSTIPFLTTLDIFSYAGSTYKTMLGANASDYNGSGGIDRNVQLWRSTSAINSINILINGAGSIAAGTTATLYGIKAA